MGTTLGDRVHLSRRDLRMKQEELARLSGVSRTYISQIETGTVDAVMTDVVIKLANALHVTVSYLLGLTDAPTGTADDGAPIDAGPNRLVFEVRDAELRAQLVEIADLLHSMTPAQRRFFVEQGQKLLRLMEEEGPHNPAKPIVIG